jgi:NAD(P)-dependent dehydrogenase (short-subunit alcohol dehydrogenase family)
VKEFSGRLAVITGGGAGMGRELARQLLAQGCHVAIIDISAASLEATMHICKADGIAQGIQLRSYIADVADEDQVLRTRDAIKAEFATDHINLLFNNAGIGRAGSIFLDSRKDWERVFAITFGGVYLCTRAFLPMLVAAEEGHIINTSSVNGFWATAGGGLPNSAYCTAKFAVKGFTEALIPDLAKNAPHVGCSVVMPGVIATDIIMNSSRIASGRPEGETPSADEIDAIRKRMRARGIDDASRSDEDVAAFDQSLSETFRAHAPTSAEEAATIILDGVKAGRWRILVGEDAFELDAKVRSDPEGAYAPDFFTLFK